PSQAILGTPHQSPAIISCHFCQCLLAINISNRYSPILEKGINDGDSVARGDSKNRATTRAIAIVAVPLKTAYAIEAGMIRPPEAAQSKQDGWVKVDAALFGQLGLCQDDRRARSE